MYECVCARARASVRVASACYEFDEGCASRGACACGDVTRVPMCAQERMCGAVVARRVHDVAVLRARAYACVCVCPLPNAEKGAVRVP